MYLSLLRVYIYPGVKVKEVRTLIVRGKRRRQFSKRGVVEGRKAAYKRAIVTLLEHTHNLAEGAGAIPLAAAIQFSERFAGQKIALVMSGGNLSTAKLKTILGD